MSPVRKAPESDPAEIVHVNVKPGRTVILGVKAFGDRATLQLPRRDAESLIASGDVEAVDPARLPDVAERPSPS